ncbi:gliding motility-associated peptidyl-prolyl isomerase GldI [Flavobacterium sp.]|uniref:gliding motility-associated peptidyl-prolyl isomerase GldI n=1 Tax=Flavobacterium sp. TaxID=239 RepID=UPI0026227789|nr:gliding motility-associated peptidyl-prolyl isomerase GldI [Flavobacterium sp.]MDG2431685.1 gliding motility-associated peptidyl-prolyl isomerase GldI [Flavobacterium sp.]
MKLIHIALPILLVTLFASCKQPQEARRPISQTSGSFMKKSVARNKKLVASEEDQIKAVIKKNPTENYIASTKGYWYTYITKNDVDTLNPEKGDVAFFDYEIKDLEENIIYSELELRPQVYRVDKQEIMMGLRDGIKLMHRNEKVTFLFPSHMGFGYHGDNKKIGVNQPLWCTVTLRDFMPETEYKKQLAAKASVATSAVNLPLSTDKPVKATPKKPSIIPKKSKDSLN